MLKLFIHYSISVATIGFDPVIYTVLEDEGPVNFNFAVLDGNIAFDLGVLFTTSDGSAISKQSNTTVLKL